MSSLTACNELFRELCLYTFKRSEEIRLRSSMSLKGSTECLYPYQYKKYNDIPTLRTAFLKINSVFEQQCSILRNFTFLTLTFIHTYLCLYHNIYC